MSDRYRRSKKIAKEALRLCGVNFRLHGRDEVHGLDCIGLAEQCLSGADVNCDAPNGYSMRGGTLALIAEFMATAGFQELSADIGSHDGGLRDGDIILVRPGLLQWHFMINTEEGFVHAHAGLRKVVLSPGAPPWPIMSIFRLLEK